MSWRRPQYDPIELGVELFTELEGTDTYGKIVESISAKHPKDSIEFYTELRCQLLMACVSMQGELIRQLTPPQEEKGLVAEYFGGYTRPTHF